MVDDLTIRIATEIDVENIYKIHTKAIRKKCSTHYGTEDVNVWVARQNQAKYLPFIAANEIIVAEKEGLGKVVGFGHLTSEDSQESDGKSMQIRGLFVDPDFGVKGVGSVPVKELEKRARECNADCVIVQSSLNAVEFYRKCGFIAQEMTTHVRAIVSSVSKNDQKVMNYNRRRSLYPRPVPRFPPLSQVWTEADQMFA